MLWLFVLCLIVAVVVFVDSFVGCGGLVDAVLMVVVVELYFDV